MIRAIDIETTGIDPQADAVIEIASVDLQAGGGIANQQEVLVRTGRPVPPEASAVHHLMDEDLAEALELRDVIERFAGADAYVAHNCAFEQSFLGQYLAGTWVCTYKCALRIWPDLPSHSNQALRYRFGLANPFGIDRRTLVVHRALSDAIVTAAVFIELTRHAPWRDLVQWSAEPALHTVLKFGKHRGQRYDQVDPSYLEWIADKSELDADTKFSARYWLEHKRAAP